MKVGLPVGIKLWCVDKWARACGIKKEKVVNKKVYIKRKGKK